MSDNARWQAVVTRDQSWDGKFVYCVKTTNIFCRPICKARLARRANVEFHDTPAEAQAAGYRACKRCQPLLVSYNPEADKVKKVCELLDNLPDTARIPDLEQLASEVKLTKHHFHRLFKRETGLTPRQYALSVRAQGTPSDSTASTVATPMTPVTPFEHDIPTSFSSDDDLFALLDFEAPMQYESKDLTTNIENLAIFYKILETTFGFLLVAFQNQQVCKMELGISEQELLESLELSFPSLYYLHSPVEMAVGEHALLYQNHLNALVEGLENPGGNALDLQWPLNDPEIVAEGVR